MDDDASPIFIGGLSHSGKTEVRIALGAHQDLELTRHTKMWDRYSGRFGDLARPQNLDRCLAALMRDEAVRRLEPQVERIRREFAQGPPSYARLFGLVHRHHAERVGKRRWGEQLGFVERFADPIFDAFPSARMIHMIRDPRTRLGEGSGRGRPGSVGWDVARWLRSAHLADRNRRRHTDRYKVVRFEELAADPAGTVRELCAFVGEAFTAEVAAAAAAIRLDGEVRDPRGSGVGHGARLDLLFVERYARRELRRFGYAPITASLTAREQLSFELIERPANRAGMTAWRIVSREAAPERMGR